MFTFKPSDNLLDNYLNENQLNGNVANNYYSHKKNSSVQLKNQEKKPQNIIKRNISNVKKETKKNIQNNNKDLQLSDQSLLMELKDKQYYQLLLQKKLLENTELRNTIEQQDKKLKEQEYLLNNYLQQEQQSLQIDIQLANQLEERNLMNQRLQQQIKEMRLQMQTMQINKDLNEESAQINHLKDQIFQLNDMVTQMKQDENKILRFYEDKIQQLTLEIQKLQQKVSLQENYLDGQFYQENYDFQKQEIERLNKQILRQKLEIQKLSEFTLKQITSQQQFNLSKSQQLESIRQIRQNSFQLDENIEIEQKINDSKINLNISKNIGSPRMLTSPSKQDFDQLGLKINSRPSSPPRINYPKRSYYQTSPNINSSPSLIRINSTQAGLSSPTTSPQRQTYLKPNSQFSMQQKQDAIENFDEWWKSYKNQSQFTHNTTPPKFKLQLMKNQL